MFLDNDNEVHKDEKRLEANDGIPENVTKVEMSSNSQANKG